LMATISALRLGHFCKTCVGIYACSILLAVAGVLTFWLDRQAERYRPAPSAIGDADKTTVDDVPPPHLRRDGALYLLPPWALALPAATATPAFLYVSALPSYTKYITDCGKLEKPEAPAGTLIHVPTPGAVQPATLFVDPLCPTCKALHQRLVSEGFFDQ